jgi:hypothetical protein
MKVPTVLGYVLTDWSAHFTHEQIAAVEAAIRDGVILANVMLDESESRHARS